MAESGTRRLPWVRITIEGATIVLSILLAFAIDAWWDRRQMQFEEEALLQDLRTTLGEDMESVVRTADTIALVNDRLQALARWIEAGKPLDSGDPELEHALSAMTRFTYVKIRYGPYETLKDRGLHLISDAGLRVLVTSLYDDRFPTLIENSRLDIDLTRNHILPYMVRSFEVDAHGRWVTRQDHADVRSRTVTLARHRSSALDRFTLPSYRTTLDAIQATLDAIDAEIGIQPALR